MTSKPGSPKAVIYEDGLKRGLDVVVAALVLILISPLLIGIALLIKLDSPGPVFFRQARSGLNGKTFRLFKFRSMSATNNVYEVDKNDEITRVGKWIRRTSLDEVPQLINVVKGEMSLIGPRPWLPEYYEVMSDEQRRRYRVRPGITGLAQSTGRNGLTIFEKIQYDLQYVDKISLKTDVKIVKDTLLSLSDGSIMDIGKHGISEEIRQLKVANGR
ncbi:sugar transferase [Corynebacterium resistens]|uniref:sugar transferase n=1 Tax=Corynebacterium resistens TaxID=258224 RepID=UPI002352BD9A|nr:sugar transferase [Corynebacterium resistens]